jgi:flagellar assembly protein FliH
VSRLRNEERGEQAAALRAEKERLGLQEKLRRAEEALVEARKHAASLEQEVVKQRRMRRQGWRSSRPIWNPGLRSNGRMRVARGMTRAIPKGIPGGGTRPSRKSGRNTRSAFASLAEQIDGVHGELRRNLEELAEANQLRLIRLWSVVLDRLLHRQVELNEATVMTLLRQVLLRVSDRERLVVYLHPEDAVSVRERRDEFADILRGIRHIEFVGDENVDRGSCLVETNLGVYDARWRTQLEQISREVDGVLLEGLSSGGAPAPVGREDAAEDGGA